MKVKATRAGNYKNRFIDAGTIFDVDPKFFSDWKNGFGWMEKVDDPKHTNELKPVGKPEVVQTPRVIQ